MANTTEQELISILQTLVGPNYTNADVNNYYDTATMAPKAPATNPDRGMQAIVETILYARNPAAFGYNVQLTATTKKELYEDITLHLNDFITAVTAVYTAINTIYTGLP